MEKEDIAARLKALASDDNRRSETARLRDIFDQVEQTLKAGVQQKDVLAELQKVGFKMTEASFKSALQRIRKERSSTKLVNKSVTLPVAAITDKPKNPLTDSKGFEFKGTQSKDKLV